MPHMNEDAHSDEAESDDAERIIRRFVPKLATKMRQAVEEKMASLGRPLTASEVEECAIIVGKRLVLRLFDEQD
jgi:hypothetical protein